MTTRGEVATLAPSCTGPTGRLGTPSSLPCAPMELRTTRREVAGHVVLALDGDADLASAPALHDALQRLARHIEPEASVAIDLDGAGVVDDTALGLLLGAAANVRARGGTVRVICADGRLRDRLAATRFDRAVDVTRSLAEPVADPPTGLS